MKERILDYIRKSRHVSFVNLSRDIEGFSGGTKTMGWANENILLWSGLHQEAINALVELTKDGLIHMTAVHILVYFADGEVPRLPIAKSKRKYIKEHWMPIVFNPGRASVRPSSRRHSKHEAQ